VSLGARSALALFAGMLLWAVLPPLGGWSSTVVMSDSMAPRLVTGDVVLVRPVRATELRAGQVLLVDDPDHPERLRLHRLLEIAPGTGMLTMKGDANQQPDSTPVSPDDVHGIAALRVPWIGSPSVWLSHGRAGAVAGAGAVLTAVALLAWCYRPQPATRTSGGEPTGTPSPDERADPGGPPTADPGSTSAEVVARP
jgi:signal peptidase I